MQKQNQRSIFGRVFSVLLVIYPVSFSVIVQGAHPSPTPEKAFAVIGPALVKGNFHKYPPFYSNVIAPHAVVEKGRIYCAFQNTKGQPVVMGYNIDKQSWAGPVTASDFGLGKDAHGNPSICLDRKGHIHVFYGSHGRSQRHTRSKNPYDISSWVEQTPPTSRATYPQSMRLADGSLYLFYRAGGHMEPWSLRISSDNGKTWSAAEKVIEMRLAPKDRLAAAYASIAPGTDGKTIHCFWVHKDDNAARVKPGKPHPWRPLKYPGLHEAVYRYNMYYILRDANGVWRNIEGKKVKLPVSKAFADKHCLVFDSGDEFTNIGRPVIDKNNRPFVRFRYGVGDWKKGGKRLVPWQSRYTHYDGSKWQVLKNIQKSWPEKVQTLLSAHGPVIWGDPTDGNWFNFYKHSQNSGSYIYLYHDTKGYASRMNGPARLP